MVCHQKINYVFWRFILLVMVIFFTIEVSSTKQSKIEGIEMNAIDHCWRFNPEWRKHQQQLATYSVGYAGKMTNNIEKGLIHYIKLLILVTPL